MPRSLTRNAYTLSHLMARGVLHPGQLLIWQRPRCGERHYALVTPDASLLLYDGSVHRTPSGAAKHLVRRPEDGWFAWATEDGRLLDDLRRTVV
ncbi:MULTISPECIES: restriction system modified-DNA reader domain-containing protein [Streptomyces]|uniref:restriction system modified-DNA reader domain-containing protein n=1 Tax=Streptomyces TaxID=1883 RepID=UPI0035AFE62F|nr:hypothetical protein [Streptomyces malaysiensis]